MRYRQRARIIVGFSAVAVLIGFLAQAAEANSRFKVRNTLEKSIAVVIYNGDDGVCSFSSKLSAKEVGSKGSRSMGCKGGGKHRCKVSIAVAGDTKNPCSDSNDTCDRDALIVPNGHALIVETSETDSSYSCRLEE